MFRPLSLLLEWFSGHPYYRDSNHEWVSEAADVRLVKACAGINFLLMSLVAYGWILRPGRQPESAAPVWMAKRFLLFCAAVVAAWATGLLANSLRIIILMKLDPRGAELHRLIGMMVYVPILSLQLALGGRRDWREVFAGPVLLYLLLTVAVPLLTGNAFMNPALFANHLLYVLVTMAVMCIIYCILIAKTRDWCHLRWDSSVSTHVNWRSHRLSCGSLKRVTQCPDNNACRYGNKNTVSHIFPGPASG